jgi:putative endonuclease
VLWSVSSRRFYIGLTENVFVRLAQHNAGASKWTAKFGPWELVHQERYENYSDARKRELLLKKQKQGLGFYSETGLDPARFHKST